MDRNQRERGVLRHPVTPPQRLTRRGEPTTMRTREAQRAPTRRGGNRPPAPQSLKPDQKHAPVPTHDEVHDIEDLVEHLQLPRLSKKEGAQSNPPSWHSEKLKYKEKDRAKRKKRYRGKTRKRNNNKKFDSTLGYPGEGPPSTMITRCTLDRSCLIHGHYHFPEKKPASQGAARRMQEKKKKKLREMKLCPHPLPCTECPSMVHGHDGTQRMDTQASVDLARERDSILNGPPAGSIRPVDPAPEDPAHAAAEDLGLGDLIGAPADLDELLRDISDQENFHHPPVGLGGLGEDERSQDADHQANPDKPYDMGFTSEEEYSAGSDVADPGTGEAPHSGLELESDDSESDEESDELTDSSDDSDDEGGPPCPGPPDEPHGNFIRRFQRAAALRRHHRFVRRIRLANQGPQGPVQLRPAPPPREGGSRAQLGRVLRRQDTQIRILYSCATTTDEGWFRSLREYMLKNFRTYTTESIVAERAGVRPIVEIQRSGTFSLFGLGLTEDRTKYLSILSALQYSVYYEAEVYGLLAAHLVKVVKSKRVQVLDREGKIAPSLATHIGYYATMAFTENGPWRGFGDVLNTFVLTSTIIHVVNTLAIDQYRLRISHHTASAPDFRSRVASRPPRDATPAGLGLLLVR